MDESKFSKSGQLALGTAASLLLALSAWGDGDPGKIVSSPEVKPYDTEFRCMREAQEAVQKKMARLRRQRMRHFFSDACLAVEAGNPALSRIGKQMVALSFDDSEAIKLEFLRGEERRRTTVHLRGTKKAVYKFLDDEGKPVYFEIKLQHGPGSKVENSARIDYVAAPELGPVVDLEKLTPMNSPDQVISRVAWSELYKPVRACIADLSKFVPIIPLSASCKGAAWNQPTHPIWPKPKWPQAVPTVTDPTTPEGTAAAGS